MRLTNRDRVHWGVACDRNSEQRAGDDGGEDAETRHRVLAIVDVS